MAAEKTSLGNLVGEQKYNSKKASKYKRLYYTLNILSILLALSSAAFAKFETVPSWIIVVVPLVYSFLTALNMLFDSKKQWLLCRMISERLKREKRCYECNLFSYAGLTEEQKNKELGEKLESIIARGNSEWEELINSEIEWSIENGLTERTAAKEKKDSSNLIGNN